jgi:hypothetical protein
MIKLKGTIIQMSHKGLSGDQKENNDKWETLHLNKKKRLGLRYGRNAWNEQKIC